MQLAIDFHMQLNLGGLQHEAVRANLYFSRLRTASLALLALMTALVSPLRADSGLLALSQDAAPNGGRVVLDVNFTSANQSQAAGLQWALAYSARSVANISVAPGAGAIGAGKSVACYQLNSTYSCLAAGLNSNPMQSGLLAQVTVTFAPLAGSGFGVLTPQNVS